MTETLLIAPVSENSPYIRERIDAIVRSVEDAMSTNFVEFSFEKARDLVFQALKENPRRKDSNSVLKDLDPSVRKNLLELRAQFKIRTMRIEESALKAISEAQEAGQKTVAMNDNHDFILRPEGEDIVKTKNDSFLVLAA